VAAGFMLALRQVELPSTLTTILLGAIKTVLVIMWAMILSSVGSLVLSTVGRGEGGGLLQPKTLPLFSITLKVLIFGAAMYFILAAWHIDMTTWLASAGVVGIAVGFAAKDTLANLFAGVFILADAPYKIGDFIVIDGVTRGRITDIGIRSSRLLTRDDVEVTVPNAVIANAKIVNETGGRNDKMRVRVKVGVAYGSDVPQVRQILLDCVADVPHVCANPTPRVRFREMADSALVFELLVWAEEPIYRGRVLDALNENVYDALRAAEVEIPYPKRDVYLRTAPDAPSAEDPTG